MSKNKRSLLIIGGGLAGISAGCYGRMNGYQTKIFEMHSIPGGCCTAWERKGYIFDQCIDWFLGTKPGNDMNRVWRELGAIQGKKISYFEHEFNRVVTPEGDRVSFYPDPDGLETHLRQIAPEDAELIKEFTDGIRLFSKNPNFPFLKPDPLWNLLDKIKNYSGLLPFIRAIIKYVNIPIVEYANRFKNPVLRQALPFIFQQKNYDFPLLPYFYNLAAMNIRNAGYPEGGSLGLAKSIEKRYLDLGGAIEYGKRVKKVLTEKDQAVGVELEDGSKHYADIIISAIDGRTAIFDLLEAKYTDATIRRLYQALTTKDTEKVKIYEGFVLLFLGLDRDLSREPSSTTYLLKDASGITGVLQNSIVVRHYCHHEPSFAPPGHSVMAVFYYSEYDCWKKLYDSDRESYQKEKESTAQTIIEHLEGYYPGIKGQIKAMDISTPVTAERYTGNYKGTVMAWVPFGDTDDYVKPLINQYRMQLPGLSNFYMCGHWLSTGALVRAAASGRFVIQFICKKDRRRFKVSLAQQEGIGSIASPTEVGRL